MNGMQRTAQVVAEVELELMHVDARLGQGVTVVPMEAVEEEAQTMRRLQMVATAHKASSSSRTHRSLHLRSPRKQRLLSVQPL